MEEVAEEIIVAEDIIVDEFVKKEPEKETAEEAIEKIMSELATKNKIPTDDADNKKEEQAPVQDTETSKSKFISTMRTSSEPKNEEAYSEGAKTLEVRATDRFGRVYSHTVSR